MIESGNSRYKISFANRHQSVIPITAGFILSKKPADADVFDGLTAF